MPRINNIEEVQAALIDYESAVNESSLKDSSKFTYLLHAHHFVRWLDNDFEPGERLRRQDEMRGRQDEMRDRIRRFRERMAE